MRSTKDQRLLILLGIYNDFVSRISPLKQLRGKKNAKLSENFFYEDLEDLDLILTELKVSAHDYIEFQFRKWQAPCSFARQFPSIKQMASLSAIEKYVHSHATPKENLVSTSVLVGYSERKKVELMGLYNISEEELLKDPLFLPEFSEEYLVNNTTFMKLFGANYYADNFGISHEELLPLHKELYAIK